MASICNHYSFTRLYKINFQPEELDFLFLVDPYFLLIDQLIIKIRILSQSIYSIIARDHPMLIINQILLRLNLLLNLLKIRSK